jgi:RNA polymerase sigma-70 factor (ECF subfamily)
MYASRDTSNALTRCPSDAEDLVQAVFLKLATTGAPLLAVRNPANYLHRILRAAWIDEHRRPAVSREAPLQEDDDASLWDGRLARRSGRAADADDVDAAIDVTRALARLPAVQREIVQLHLIEGFSFREAGRITGVSMFTAASRYRVALERLRQMTGRR